MCFEAFSLNLCDIESCHPGCLKRKNYHVNRVMKMKCLAERNRIIGRFLSNCSNMQNKTILFCYDREEGGGGVGREGASYSTQFYILVCIT